MIVELPLDIVLLGSRLGAGPLEVAALAVVTLLWLLFGVWLWRSSASARPGLLAVFYVMPASGLVAASLAQDAALFYAGLAAAGYGSLAALLLAHGAGHSRTAAAQATLLVLSDLILFELLVYLYAEAQTVTFDGLRAAYADRGSGLTFVAGLLVFAAGSRIAALFLLLPLSAGLPAWRMGAASALGATAVVAGPLLVVRLVDPSFATSAACIRCWQCSAQRLRCTCSLSSASGRGRASMHSGGSCPTPGSEGCHRVWPCWRWPAICRNGSPRVCVWRSVHYYPGRLP